jgi:hypothetical protein
MTDYPLANAVFDILVAECGAHADLRANFVAWYVDARINSPSGAEFWLGKLRCRLADGQWSVFVPHQRMRTVSRLTACERGNQRLNDLACALRRMSPLERLDWVHEQERQRTEMGVTL